MTAKLIELGYPSPMSEVKAERAGDNYWCNPAYSIGELINLLPRKLGGWALSIDSCVEWEQWHVYYNPALWMIRSTELIYALFNALVKIKQEANF